SYTCFTVSALIIDAPLSALPATPAFPPLLPFLPLLPSAPPAPPALPALPAPPAHVLQTLIGRGARPTLGKNCCRFGWGFGGTRCERRARQSDSSRARLGRRLGRRGRRLHLRSARSSLRGTALAVSCRDRRGREFSVPLRRGVRAHDGRIDSAR